MKDYKPRSRSSANRPARGGTLLGIFIGLVLGLAIATVIAVYMTKAPVPFVNKAPPPRAAAPAQDRSLAEAARPAEAPRAPVPTAEPSKADKQRFDFYRILPGQEEPVSDKELRQAAAKKGTAGPRETYVIQAGAFQNPADADNLKARLALIGLQASVEPAILPDKGTWYRVRLGPYAQLEDINRVRGQLAQNGVEASLVKLKEQ
jgi:cell division protein FtsN